MSAHPEPAAELIHLPDGYGTPKRPLAWAVVRELLEQSMQYWLVTTRPDGRAHVVPVDGVWLDDVWYHGGAPGTVHLRNLEQNPAAVLHLEDALRAVIVEGINALVKPPKTLATRLAKAANAKYGYGASARGYEKEGVWAMTPERAIAWATFSRGRHPLPLQLTARRDRLSVTDPATRLTDRRHKRSRARERKRRPVAAVNRHHARRD